MLAPRRRKVTLSPTRSTALRPGVPDLNSQIPLALFARRKSALLRLRFLRAEQSHADPFGRRGFAAGADWARVGPVACIPDLGSRGIGPVRKLRLMVLVHRIRAPRNRKNLRPKR